jgi:hypothetical protein
MADENGWYQSLMVINNISHSNSVIFWPFFGHFSVISQSFLSHFSVISQSFLGHFLVISWSFLNHFSLNCQKLSKSVYCNTIHSYLCNLNIIHSNSCTVDIICSCSISFDFVQYHLLLFDLILSCSISFGQKITIHYWSCLYLTRINETYHSFSVYYHSILAIPFILHNQDVLMEQDRLNSKRFIKNLVLL